MLERGTEGIFQCGRKIISQELDEIRETVGMFPRLSRSELAATICEHLRWMTASGGYKKDACILARHTDQIHAKQLSLHNGEI